MSKFSDWLRHWLLTVVLGDMSQKNSPPLDNSEIVEFQKYLKNANPPPLKTNSVFFKIENILTATDPLRDNKSVYLHFKRVNKVFSPLLFNSFVETFVEPSPYTTILMN